MMDEFIRFIEGGSPAALIVLTVIALVTIAVAIMIIIAFVQGREVALWPPRIGAKPDTATPKAHLPASDGNPRPGDQVAAVCYRRVPSTGLIEFLLVSTRPSHEPWEEGKPARWLFPKKPVNAGDIGNVHAVAEFAASDEAGVTGRVDTQSFMQSKHHKNGAELRVWNYLLEVDESQLQKDAAGHPVKPVEVTRLWKWFSRDEAFRAVAELRVQGRHVANRDELRNVISEADRLLAM